MITVPFGLHAMGKMRPVLDSTATCSYFKSTYEFSENAAEAKQMLDVFYIVEEMPGLMNRKMDIEEYLNGSLGSRMVIALMY